MLRIGRILLGCVWLALPSGAAAQDRAPAVTPAPVNPVLNDDQLFRKYVLSTVGPGGMIGAAAAAAYEQTQNYPDEWGRSASGYAKRWASAYAAGAIGNTTKYAVARALHQDPSFARCRCRGVGPRMRHAAFSVFIARTRSGREVLSPATIAGLAAEHVVPATVWFPRDKWRKEALGLAAVGIAAKVGINIFHEFVGRPKIVLAHD